MQSFGSIFSIKACCLDTSSTMASFSTILAVGSMPLAGAMPVYSGNGCFWTLQDDFVDKFERAALGRDDVDVTSLTGYAGSSRTGPDGQICYSFDSTSNYDTLGHAEVLQVQVPEDSLEAAFSVFFQSFRTYSFEPGIWERKDFGDSGPAYRAVLGFPRGVDNAEVMAAVRQANVNNMTLREGQGSDADTRMTNTVLVMDSDKFPFTQAEPCMQFYAVTPSNLALRKVFEDSGRIVDFSCPTISLCDHVTKAVLV